MSGCTAQEVDHHLTAHANEHGDGDHENEQSDHEPRNTETDGGGAERAEEDNEWENSSRRAVNGGRSIADAVEVHVSTRRKGLVGFGRAVLVDEVLDEAHHVGGDAQQHHGPEHDEKQGDENGDVVDDTGFCKGLTHEQGDDTDDAKEGPHAEAREHTDVEGTRHPSLEFPLFNELIFPCAQREIVGDETGQDREGTG